MDKTTRQMIATCPEETKDATAFELEKHGATDIRPAYRALQFCAEESTYYKLHLKLRTASRLLRVIREFSAHSPEMLFDQARRISWPDVFDVGHGYLIDGVQTDRGPNLMSSNDISKKVREALQAVFEQKVGKTPKVDLKTPKVVIVAHINNGQCTISIDTSGKALHKRGYRQDGHPAPIKETMAAAMLQLAGYDGSQAFIDPMCGSGTIAIEAAMIALHKAPLIHRKKGEFGFEWLKDFNRPLWKSTQDNIRNEKLDSPEQPIAASDIDGTFVDMARKAALRARVERHINFFTGSFQKILPPATEGILVTNLPYGERIGGDTVDIKPLYTEIGDALKQNFQGWRAGLLVAEEAPHKFIGLKPSRRFHILNGSIRCKFLIFDIYGGSRKGKYLDNKNS